MLVPIATWIIDPGSHTEGAELACMFHTWLHPIVGTQPPKLLFCLQYPSPWVYSFRTNQGYTCICV